MRKLNYFYKLITTLILLSLLWVSMLFLFFSLPSQKASLKQFLPDDIDMVISVNTHQLISTLFIDAIYKTEFNSKDLKFFQNSEFSESKQFKGIDFNSEVVFFYDTWDGSKVKGLLFNLSNPKIFKNMTLQQKNVVKESNEQRGVIIYLDEDASHESIEYYTAFAQKIISKEPILPLISPPNEMINLNFKGNKFSYIQDLVLNLELKNEHLLITGTGRLDSIPPLRQMSLIMEPSSKEYFEIQSGKLPDSVYQYIDDLTNQMNIKLPGITSQQILIYGISLNKVNSSPLFLPKMDCILRFDSIVQLDSLLESLGRNSDLVNIVDGHIEVGKIKYYCRQLSKNEIYVGVTESPEIQKLNMRVLPLTKGFPSTVLDIEGEGIIVRIINLMPQVKNSKLFLKGVEYYDIHSEYIDDQYLQIKGDIRLGKNEMMSIGLAEFILKFFNK